MHNLGTVSASRLTSAPRLEYTKIHGLSICPYQNQSHFNRILKSCSFPAPRAPLPLRTRPVHAPAAVRPAENHAVSARHPRSTPHIPVPAHPPPVFHIPWPARLRARVPSAGSATAPPLPPRYSPRKSAPNRPPRPRALRTSPHLLIRRPFFTSRVPPVSAPGLPPPVPRLLPAPACTPHIPAPASARTPHIPAPAHLPPVFHIPPPARLRARAPSAGSATAPPLPPRYSPRKSAPNRLPAPRLWCRMSLASEA